MGFFSNLCAVSGQSIPANCVEPCDVTVFLPDGTTRSGVYDGYGNVDGFDVRDALRSHYKDVKHEPDLIVSVTPIGGAWDVRTASGAEYRQTGTREEAESVTASHANDHVEFEFIEEHIKMVKTAYVTPDMTYKNLPVSKRCPEQGYFYGRGKPWNKPAYKPGK